MTLLPDELKDGCQLVAAERFGQARARTQIRCGGSVEMIQGFRKGTLDGTLRPFGRGMGTDRAGAAWRRWNAACRSTDAGGPAGVGRDLLYPANGRAVARPARALWALHQRL